MNALPSGTVTLLFSDVEGSCARHGSARPATAARYSSGDDPGADRERGPGGRRDPRSRPHQLKDIQHKRVFLLALKEQASDFPPLKSAAAESSADTLAREIERRVHADILASFGRRRDPTRKLAKLSLLGLLILALLVAAAAVILLIVRAVL